MPLALTCATGLVSAADSKGNTTSEVILLTVTRSCSWLACSEALAAVFTITWMLGLAFSRSCLASPAQYTAPAMKLCVAAGMDTPSTSFLACASAGAAASIAALTAATSASLRVNFVIFVSLGLDGGLAAGVTTLCSSPPPLQEGDDDDYETLHRGIQ